MFRVTVGFIFICTLLDLHVTQETKSTFDDDDNVFNTTEKITTARTTVAPESIIFKKLRNDWTVLCKLQPNGYDCTKTGFSGVPRFYYDVKMEDCRTAAFGRCSHNYNQFSTITQCHEVCREPGMKAFDRNLNMSALVFCRLQYDFGYCNDYEPMWYFDMTIRTCRGFSYSGCGGNQNRFPTAQMCTAICGSTLA